MAALKHPNATAMRTATGSATADEGPRIEVVAVGPASVETAVVEAVEREYDIDKAGTSAGLEEAA